jgi:hypothetical protein
VKDRQPRHIDPGTIFIKRQSEKFKEEAGELGADEDEEALTAKLKLTA